MVVYAKSYWLISRSDVPIPCFDSEYLYNDDNCAELTYITNKPSREGLKEPRTQIFKRTL